MMQAVLPSHFRMRMLPGFSRMLWRKPGDKRGQPACEGKSDRTQSAPCGIHCTEV